MKLFKPWMLILMMVILDVIGWYFCYFYSDNTNLFVLIVLILYTIAVIPVLFFFINIKDDKLSFLQKCYVVKNGGNPYKNIYTWFSFIIPLKVFYKDILEVKYSNDKVYVSINMKNKDRYIISLLTYPKKAQSALEVKFNELGLIKEGE